MPVLPPVHSPRAALRDLAKFLRQRDREKTIGGILAVLATALIVLVFVIDAKVNTAPPATITYMESWPEDRSDEEIIAQQKIDQAKKDEALEKRRQEFEKLQDINKKIGVE